MLGLMLFLMMISGNVYDYTPMTVNTDPNYHEGTYEEWLAGQPDYEPFEVRTISGTDGAEFLLIFEEGLTDSLTPGLLDQWTTDIQSGGLSTEVVEVTYSQAEELKTYLQEKYSQGMQGAVLVGNLPTAWCALEDAKEANQSGETFPADYFYMELDGIWLDNWIGYPFMGNPGSDGMYDTFSGSLDPEIYVGRIRIDNLSALGDPTEILCTYLERNHDWRINGDPEPLTALCYVDDDWAPWAPSYQAAMQYLYPSTELVSDEAQTNGTDYIENRLPAEYVWISPFVHSNAGGHYWSPGPTTLWNQLVPALPHARFYNLFACSNCRFTTVHCMGSVYSLCTGSGLGAVGSTKSGAMLNFNPFYLPLADGSSLGEAYRDWWEYIASGGLTPGEKSWHLGMVLLGDPSLMPAMHILGIEEGVPPETALSISLSGNPCTGSVTVSLHGGETGIVEIYDISGRLSATGELTGSECTVDLRDLASGCYIVRVSSDSGTASAALTLID
ncbi:MAG: T9SS type A sorting domain-containing protein [Candidatus Fermentibacteraceae bacterium]|nr:T9SS type A sorting domain-containing protein [Candidatus Fermentibacteraceae bacterium]MBN2607535.1 T9SS type A sorting domain-containing protein [Candidatus Fermentibacteraceae bacterium]